MKLRIHILPASVLVVGMLGGIMASGSLAASSFPNVLGITGEIDTLEVAVPAEASVKPVDRSAVPADIDLKRMAEWALHYLTNSPRKQFNYDPVFQCFPLQYPPAPDKTDPIVPCDTDARMDWEWYYMRDITGSHAGRDVETAFHKRMRSYVDANGIVWSHPGCYNEGDTSAVYSDKDRIIHIWGATKILKSLSEDYKRTKNPESKALARKIMLGLKGLATWDDKGRCWLACGMGGMKADRTPAPMSAQPAPLVESLVVYWESTGDKEALDFAKAYAEGIIEGLQPGSVQFAPDGNFGGGHGHITMHAVWGVAHLGLVTGDRRYSDFGKRVCDWMMSRGTGTGWFPAAPVWAQSCTEVCCISDMMSTAACVARNGHPEYFDYVERCMRNYIAPLQFIETPEFKAKYRETNKALSEEQIRKGLAESGKFQGGFFNAGLNDMENALLGGGGYVWKIAGCCAPEGIRAIYTTWQDSITRLPGSPLGPAGVYVNMNFSRDSKWGKVVSFLPDTGRLTVTASVEDCFFVRPPHWAPKDDIRAFVNSEAVPVKWSGDYVRFDANPGDELTITYPIVRFTHHVKGLWENVVPGLEMTYNWIGNMVMRAYPEAKPGCTPFFTGKIRVLPPVQAR